MESDNKFIILAVNTPTFFEKQQQTITSNKINLFNVSKNLNSFKTEHKNFDNFYEALYKNIEENTFAKTITLDANESNKNLWFNNKFKTLLVEGQSSKKWKVSQDNVKVGDLVLMRGENIGVVDGL